MIPRTGFFVFVFDLFINKWWLFGCSALFIKQPGCYWDVAWGGLACIMGRTWIRVTTRTNRRASDWKRNREDGMGQGSFIICGELEVLFYMMEVHLKK